MLFHLKDSKLRWFSWLPLLFFLEVKILWALKVNKFSLKSRTIPFFIISTWTVPSSHLTLIFSPHPLLLFCVAQDVIDWIKGHEAGISQGSKKDRSRPRCDAALCARRRPQCHADAPLSYGLCLETKHSALPPSCATEPSPGKTKRVVKVLAGINVGQSVAAHTCEY